MANSTPSARDGRCRCVAPRRRRSARRPCAPPGRRAATAPGAGPAGRRRSARASPSASAMATASRGQLVASGRIGVVATSTDVNMLRMRTLVALLVGRQRGDRLLHQVDELAIGGLADVEADARQRRHPALGGSGQQHRLTRRPAPTRRPRARPPTAAVRSPWARAVSQRSSASSARSRVVDLVGDERVDALDPRRGVLVGADVERAPSRRQPGARSARRVRRAIRPPGGGGRASTGDDPGSLASSIAAATRRCRSRRRVRPMRARIA